MPLTIRSLFEAASVTPTGVTPWGTRPSCRENGVYVVALTNDPNSLAGTLDAMPVSHEAIGNWLIVQQHLTVDGLPASVDSVGARLSRYWLSSEVILYIGKTAKEDGLCGRVGQFYRHVLGRHSPHRGGHWIKTLSVLEQLFVHYAPCLDPVSVESIMIGAFCNRNPAGPFPFANLEWRADGRRYCRDHGIR